MSCKDPNVVYMKDAPGGLEQNNIEAEKDKHERDCVEVVAGSMNVQSNDLEKSRQEQQLP